MASYRLAIAILWLLSCCAAQQNGPNTYTLAGTIVNGVTGSPVPRVLVQLSDRALLTGPEGEFSFAAVPGGQTQITISKPGFFTPGATTIGWSPPVNVDVGPGSGKFIFKFLPEAVISGLVTGQDEEPLEGAAIQILHFASENGRKRLVRATGDARTDEDGKFRIAALPAGRYYVAVKAGNVTRRILGAQSSKGSEAYPGIVYYPGTQALEGATPLDLAPGQRSQVQFSLNMEPAFKVAGTVVTTGDWKQVNSPAIIDQLDQVLFTADRFDSETGQFEFHAVAAGKYKVQLGGMDQQGQFVSSARTFTVSRAIMGLKLALKPGAEIPIVVRTEFSKPRPASSCTSFTHGGEIREFDCSEAARVDLISSDSLGLRFTSGFGRSKDRGPLALHNVAPGRYVVSAAAATLGGYVQSVRSGQVDLLRDELVVPEEGSVPPIEVIVRDDPGTLNVHLQTQTPDQSGTVLLIPDGLLRDPIIVGRSSANMELHSGPLAPGIYKVFAFDSLDTLDYRNPEALAKYTSRAASATVSPNGNSSVIVELIRVGEQ